LHNAINPIQTFLGTDRTIESRSSLRCSDRRTTTRADGHWGQNVKLHDADLLQSELYAGRQYTETILDAAPEADGRCIFEVFGRTRNFTDAEAKIHALCQHLIVEYEVVGILNSGTCVNTVRLKAR
jgi:hypothetical protein